MKKIILMLTAAIFLLPLFNSCSSHSEGTSFISRLDDIDYFISAKDPSQALKLLKKAEKKAYSSLERLGIYKRYILLGEEELGRKCLENALKKLPDSPELSAVYTEFLLQHNEFEKAFEVSKCLKNTVYSSFYAESFFRLELKKKTPDIFWSPETIEIYNLAFKGSNDSKWLRNAACIYLLDGNFKSAVSLFKNELYDIQDVLFWGKVFYDAGLFSQSSKILLSEIPSLTLEQKIQRLSLEADNLYLLGEDDNSSEKRQQIISILENEFQTSNEESLNFYNEYMTYASMNQALYFNRKGDVENEFKHLYFLLEHFPDYVEALKLYGTKALELLNKKDETEIQKELRSSGLKTLEMEKQDSLPKVLISDVTQRAEKLYVKNKSPSAGVFLETIKNELNKELPSYQKTARVWTFLEENEISSGVYPEEVMKYALNLLVKAGEIQESRNLFENYIKAIYSENFNVIADYKKLKFWELEYFAWFAATEGNRELSLLLYSYITDTYAERTSSLQSKSDSVVNALVNLAVVYASTLEEEKALECLNKASAVTSDSLKKAEILYRMAKLSNSSGDYTNAKRSLQYSIQLNPSSNKARVLLKSLNKTE